MNYLHQEKCLRDHGACRRLALLVNPLMGDIAAQAAAVRLRGLNLTSWNPRQVLHKPPGRYVLEGHPHRHKDK
jgi:hypothetical protein